MNCHAASRLLSAERDAALSSEEGTRLAGHLAECGHCRQARAAVAASISGWRSSTDAVVPDVERAWQEIRRETRGVGSARSRQGSGPARRWAAPLGAVAAVAIAVGLFTRHGGPSKSSSLQLAQHREMARADFVEVPGDASSLVYVDDRSGWLVVWSVSDPPRQHPPAGG